MKVFLGSVLSIAFFVMCYYSYRTSKEEHKLASVVRNILTFGLLIVLVNLVSLYTTSRMVCMLMYSIYFVAADWMLYYLFRFSLEYIGNEFEKHVKKNAMIALLCVDSIFVLLNNVFEYAFKLKPVTVMGEGYFELQVKPFFYVHYSIVLMLVTFCLITLFYKSFTAPVFYRNKYLLIAIIMVILVVLNFLMVQSAIDISVIGYAIEGICIYYCVFVYTPQRLLQKTLFHVAHDMAVALYVMDIEGKILYKNGLAQNLLDAENLLIDKDGKTLEEWCRVEYMGHDEEFTKEQAFYRGNEEMILKIQLQRMVDAKRQLQGGYFVVQDRTEEINQLKRERYLATHDSLTGLYNKEHFCEKVEQYIKTHEEQELLVICTDVKEFKMINDFLGAKTGDVVLQNIGKMLKNQIKDAIYYGRLGNDIFGILMPKEAFDEKYFECKEEEVFFAGIDKTVSFPIINYIGVYEVKNRNLQVSVMCDRARMAIANIKGDYHKRVTYYDNALRENILYEQELIKDLARAITENQLKMYLQPQMSTDGKLLGAEALVRWMHPEKGQIMPGDFIPVFEKNGLISDVDMYIWEIACKQLRKWKDEGREDLYISVNISPRDFYFMNIYQIFTELVSRYEIDPQNLKLEITETAVVMDFKRQLELINRLRKSGFVVEMDDFGSGYSSLNMLKDIHVDILKIDMAFLKKASDEERSRKILQMIIGLSKQLDMPVITEGVETAEQVAFLAEMGCDMFQGYYFAKPMEVSRFEETYLM